MSEQKRNRFSVTRILKRMLATVLVITLVWGTIHATASDDAYYYVDLHDGKHVTTAYTAKTIAKDVLAEAGIPVSSYDTIDDSKFQPGADGCVITVNRPNLVGVNDESGTVYFTFDGTVAEAIEEAKVTIGKEDLVNYKENAPVQDGMIISVARAFPVTVCYHGKKIPVQMAVGTVGDALKKAGVTPGKNDRVSIDLKEVVSSGMSILVDEIIYKERVQTQIIPFASVCKKDSSMAQGAQRITTKGEDGQLEVTYRDKFVNGELRDTAKINEKIIKKSVTQVTSIGTKKIYNVRAKGVPYSTLGTVPLDSNGVPQYYTKVFTGSGTAYTGGTGTASGRKPAVGLVAVDPKKIPYGTHLYIVATDGTVYGYCIAADTGGFIYDGRTIVDVYMDSYEDCVQWGRKNVNVYVLD